MRKYQQLCLIVISLVSIVVLLMYRSENSRLKYVLEVVNFFGRSDNAISKLENTTKIFLQNYDLANPMPAWTRIGTDFHVYSTFWNNNTLKAGGLESISLVAGIGNVQFQCEMEFENGKSQRGKFMFTREDVSDAHNDAKSESFVIYTFICKINRDFGYPKKIVFIDTNSHSRHAVNIRTNKVKPEQQFLTVCLNLAQIGKKTNFRLSDNRFLQFFYHHSFIGIENFLIYDTDDLLSTKVRQILFKNGININILPYNFPFESHHRKQVQRILEMDCLHRTKFFSKYAIISSPNEFLYTDANIKSPLSPLKQLKKHPADRNLFELPVRTICVDKAVAQLAHNNRSRIDGHEMTFSLYKPDYKFDDSEAVRVEGSKMFMHRYETCDGDGKVATLEWRTTVTAPFLEYYDTIAREVKIMGSHEG
ncbi:hypothetical protein HA402_007439 [Bradysia odoriphaga]|nr:hypothetical protein HA402_007439 [Bradysia odoriphaga]